MDQFKVCDLYVNMCISFHNYPKSLLTLLLLLLLRILHLRIDLKHVIIRADLSLNLLLLSRFFGIHTLLRKRHQFRLRINFENSTSKV
jgi:hypothetical protein